jgi:hypothetical protein
MFIIERNTPVKRVPGLKGSDTARAENLDATGPYRPLGGQPLFGSGSGDGDGGNLGSQGDCEGDSATLTTGGASGGGPTGKAGNPFNDMSRAGQNGCWQSTPIPNRPSPPCKCPPPGGGAGGPGGGPGCDPCRGDL